MKGKQTRLKKSRQKVKRNQPTPRDDVGRFFKFCELVTEGRHGKAADVDLFAIQRGADGAPEFYLFEAVACDTVKPENSHPRRYWHKHIGRFLALWALILALRGAGFRARFCVLNYRDDASKIKLLHVTKVTQDAIETGWWRDFTFVEFQEWFKAFETAAFPIEEVLPAVGRVTEKKHGSD